ncbi:MAG TPA: SPOR domain-containing protein [Steroidobacteraceae bacterium]|nr:SPOR domain-containing protein [Steroidobacteraceae bacterium]
MDSRAKQRLTGAVILVALFVLLVPELLTGPRKGEDAPSEDGMRQYTIDLDSPTSSVRPAQAPAPAVELPAVAPAPARPDDSRAVPGESAQPVAEPPTPAPSVAAPVAAPTPRAETTTPAAPKPAPVVTTAPVTPMASAPASPAAGTAAPAPKPEPPRAETPHAESPKPVVAAAPAKPAAGSFAVQLGSFVNKENADGLVKEMTAKGFNAFVAPPIMTGGRALYRVRVGPTRDRASAEALATQLRRIGQAGSIVPIS